jgi:hypothetical protein
MSSARWQPTTKTFGVSVRQMPSTEPGNTLAQLLFERFG